MRLFWVYILVIFGNLLDLASTLLGLKLPGVSESHFNFLSFPFMPSLILIPFIYFVNVEFNFPKLMKNSVNVWCVALSYFAFVSNALVIYGVLS